MKKIRRSYRTKRKRNSNQTIIQRENNSVITFNFNQYTLENSDFYPILDETSLEMLAILNQTQAKLSELSNSDFKAIELINSQFQTSMNEREATINNVFNDCEEDKKDTILKYIFRRELLNKEIKEIYKAKILLLGDFDLNRMLLAHKKIKDLSICLDLSYKRANVVLENPEYKEKCKDYYYCIVCFTYYTVTEMTGGIKCTNCPYLYCSKCTASTKHNNLFLKCKICRKGKNVNNFIDIEDYEIYINKRNYDDKKIAYLYFYFGELMNRWFSWETKNRIKFNLN